MGDGYPEYLRNAMRKYYRLKKETKEQKKYIKHELKQYSKETGRPKTWESLHRYMQNYLNELKNGFFTKH